MGRMLKRVVDKLIDEQGERMVPSFHKDALVFGEHIVRYESVLPLLQGKIVLDIASGSGYGSYIMAGAAKKVIGVDIDRSAVAYAKKNYSRTNIEFRQGSAELIPLEDASVDVVVTFETIEHVKNYKKFMSEIKRVLRPDGIAIISTPNDPEFPEGNHFHLHEFTQEELEGMIAHYFKHSKFTYQYTWLYTAIMDEARANSEGEISLATINAAPIPKEKAIYFMAICSDGNIDNLHTKELAAISEHWSARHQQEIEKGMKETIIKNKETIVRLQANLDEVYRSRGWRLLSVFYKIEIKIRKFLRRFG